MDCGIGGAIVIIFVSQAFISPFLALQQQQHQGYSLAVADTCFSVSPTIVARCNIHGSRVVHVFFLDMFSVGALQLLPFLCVIFTVVLSVSGGATAVLPSAC